MAPPPGGTESCGAPLLRARLAKITGYERKEDFWNDKVYCVVQAEADAGSELRVTPITPPLNHGESFELSLDSGLVWGQKELRTPGGNLLLTYDCFESDDMSRWQKLIDDIGNA